VRSYSALQAPHRGTFPRRHQDGTDALIMPRPMLRRPLRHHVPVPMAGLALLDLSERHDLEPAEQRRKPPGIAIEMRMILLVLAVDDECIGRHQAAHAIARI